MVFKMVVVGNICNAFAVDLSRLPNFAKLSLAGDGVRILRFRLKEKNARIWPAAGVRQVVESTPGIETRATNW